MNARRVFCVLAAALAALPLAGCGGSDKSEEAASESSTAASPSSAAPQPVASPVPQQQAPPPADAPAPANPENTQPAPVQDPASLPESDERIGPPDTNLRPIVGGHPADPATAEEITGLVRGIGNVKTVREGMEYLPKNTCQRVIDANGGQANLDFSEIPESITLADVNMQPSQIYSVDAIQVDGPAASASVVIDDGAGGQQSNVYRFLHENGRWTFCN